MKFAILWLVLGWVAILSSLALAFVLAISGRWSEACFYLLLALYIRCSR